MSQTGAAPQTLEEWADYLTVMCMSDRPVLPDGPESFRALIKCYKRVDVSTCDYETFEDLLPRLKVASGAEVAIARTVCDTFDNGPASFWLPAMVTVFDSQHLPSQKGTRTAEDWISELGSFKEILPRDMTEFFSLVDARNAAEAGHAGRVVTPLLVVTGADKMVTRLIVQAIDGKPNVSWFTRALVALWGQHHDVWVHTGWVAQEIGTTPVRFFRDPQRRPNPDRFVNIYPLHAPDPPKVAEHASGSKRKPFLGSVLHQIRRRPVQ